MQCITFSKHSYKEIFLYISKVLFHKLLFVIWMFSLFFFEIFERVTWSKFLATLLYLYTTLELFAHPSSCFGRSKSLNIAHSTHFFGHSIIHSRCHVVNISYLKNAYVFKGFLLKIFLMYFLRKFSTIKYFLSYRFFLFFSYQFFVFGIIERS